MRRGYAELLVCTLTWGSLGVVRKHVDLPSSALAFFRLSLGAVVVLAWVAARGRLRALRPHGRPGLLVVAGVLLGIHWALELEAYNRLDVAAAILIVFIGPVLAALAAPFVLGERLRAVSIAALGLAVGGIVLITVPRIRHIDARGLFAALGSGVLFAAVLLVGKKLTEVYEPATITVWQLGIGAVIVSPALAGVSAHALARATGPVLALGIAYTGVLGVLYFRALRALEAQRFGVIAYLEPASAILYAWVLLHERPAVLTVIGGLLVVVAGITIVATDRTPVAPTALPEPIS
ncbi:MAG: DMT family transporter [Actinomycetota bacterium]